VNELIAEHEVVVLTGDVPDEGLQAGDVGVVLLAHRGHGDTPPGYTIEVTNLFGETVAVVDVSAELVRRAAPRDVRHARSVPVSA